MNYDLKKTVVRGMETEDLRNIDELLHCFRGLTIEGSGIVVAALDLRREVDRLRAELADCREQMEAVEASYADEEAAHAETLRMWEQAKAERDEARAKVHHDRNATGD